MEQNLITDLFWIWVPIIYQTKDTFQEFRTREQNVYWKHDQGLKFYTDCLEIFTSVISYKHLHFIINTIIRSHHFMENRWDNSGNSGRLYSFGFQNHCRWWLQPWNSRTLAPWKKAMTNLDSILKSSDITLPTRVHLVKAMVFPVVIHGC